MKIYKRGDNGEILMHSDTYLGEDYVSPNLVHYKYIKKERKNGRWVYYYDDPKERQLKNNITDAYEEGTQHVWLVNDMRKQKKKGKVDPVYNTGDKKYKYGTTIVKYKNGKEYDDPYDDNGYESYDFNTIDEGIKIHTKKAIEKGKEYTKAKKAYNNYQKKLKVIVNKTAVKVLNTVSSIRAKGKKLLKSIFG